MTSAPVKLGKLPKLEDTRNLKFAKYFATPEAPTPKLPLSVDWRAEVQDWGMLLNDQLGNCVEVAALHQIQAWTAYASQEFEPTDSQAIKLYEQWAGYNPDDPNTDNGTSVLTALKYWQNNGAAGHKLDAYVEVDPTNFEHVRASIAWFGCIYIGIALPLSAQYQLGTTTTQGLWTVDDFSYEGEPGSWGGHGITIELYTPEYLTCITWGTEQRMTWDFFATYCDEAYALLSPDWFKSTGVTPSGFNLSQLQADLQQVKN